MSRMFHLLENLIAKGDTLSLVTLNQVLKVGIPFNAPHGFKILKTTKDEVKISLSNRKLNHNHIGGVHACAMATLGEFCAGLNLAANLGFTRYRYVMSELKAEYHRQGRTKLVGTAQSTLESYDKIKSELAANDKAYYTHQTQIFDIGQELVATVTTTWQVKDWDKVKLK